MVADKDVVSHQVVFAECGSGVFGIVANPQTMRHAFDQVVFEQVEVAATPGHHHASSVSLGEIRHGAKANPVVLEDVSVRPGVSHVDSLLDVEDLIVVEEDVGGFTDSRLATDAYAVDGTTGGLVIVLAHLAVPDDAEMS